MPDFCMAWKTVLHWTVNYTYVQILHNVQICLTISLINSPLFINNDKIFSMDLVYKYNNSKWYTLFNNNVLNWTDIILNLEGL